LYRALVSGYPSRVRFRTPQARASDEIKGPVGDAADIMASDDGVSAWDETLASEPTPRLILQGEEIDRALNEFRGQGAAGAAADT
jgi:hypothetical protein